MATRACQQGKAAATQRHTRSVEDSHTQARMHASGRITAHTQPQTKVKTQVVRMKVARDHLSKLLSERAAHSWFETFTRDGLDTTTKSNYRRGNYESHKKSSLQIALRTSCARMKVYTKWEQRTNWDGAAGLKRTRETDWTLQLNHIIGEAIMKVTTDHLRSSLQIALRTARQL